MLSFHQVSQENSDFHKHMLAAKKSVKVLTFTLEHVTLYINPILHCFLSVYCEKKLRFKMYHIKDNHILLQGLVLTVILVSSRRCVKLRNV